MLLFQLKVSEEDQDTENLTELLLELLSELSLNTMTPSTTMMKNTQKELMDTNPENTKPSSKMLPVKPNLMNTEEISLDTLSQDSEDPKLKLKKIEMLLHQSEFTKLIMKD